MIVCERHRLLYLAPPKTGSVTVIKQLEDKPPFYGKRYNNDEAHHDTVWHPRFNDFYVFITVRHPYARMLSLWRFALTQVNRVRRGEQGNNWLTWWSSIFPGELPTFREFIYHPELESRMRNVWCCNWHLNVIQKPVDAVVYQENYQEGMRQIPHLKNIDFSVKQNAGPKLDPGKVWYDYFDADIVLRVQDLWGKDFDRFGYNRGFEGCKAGKLFSQKG
jgi:hypothetical protein